MKPATSQHTPTPWRVYDQNPLEGEVYIKADGRYNGSLVAKVVDPGDEDGMDIARDTAAFIVRAVNLHEEMLDALRTWDEFWKTMPKGQMGKLSFDVCLFSDGFVKMRKALAKAEGSEVTK